MAIGSFPADFRQAVRSVARAPLSAGALVLLLALGIGANALIFTAVDVLLLRPLPVSHPEQLVRFGTQLSPSYTYYEHPYLYARILRQRARSFSDVFVAWPMEMSFSAGDRLESITGETVSGNYFSSLGLTAEFGRLLTDEDEQRDAPVAVLSHVFWQRAFAGRKDIVGQTISLRGNPFLIIGVLRPGFVDLDLETRPDVWLTMSAGKLWFTKRDNTLAESHIFMRLRPGVSAPQAETEVRSLYPSMLEASYSIPPISPHGDIAGEAQREPPTLTTASRGVSAMRKQFGNAVGALMGGVAGLLLLVCSNTGGLMLARAETKRREAAIRMSLGASRWSMVRHTLVEASLLSSAGVRGCCLRAHCHSRRHHPGLECSSNGFEQYDAPPERGRLRSPHRTRAGSISSGHGDGAGRGQSGACADARSHAGAGSRLPSQQAHSHDAQSPHGGHQERRRRASLQGYFAASSFFAGRRSGEPCGESPHAGHRLEGIGFARRSTSHNRRRAEREPQRCQPWTLPEHRHAPAQESWFRAPG